VSRGRLLGRDPTVPSSALVSSLRGTTPRETEANVRRRLAQAVALLRELQRGGAAGELFPGTPPGEPGPLEAEFRALDRLDLRVGVQHLVLALGADAVEAALAEAEQPVELRTNQGRRWLLPSRIVSARRGVCLGYFPAVWFRADGEFAAMVPDAADAYEAVLSGVGAWPDDARLASWEPATAALYARLTAHLADKKEGP
jgi:hypothetical protein